ncbi:TetR/AcrR family transcriptional regulator [Nitratireductor mangrovi]|uniref:TetR/AcrR family transcriptional regulator n=1 Tax=Nitratireductor mangrovi TaxID=2599600 RepID=A0A5B8L5C2_9HYPH|nr:TetR/AcrR family transcriptional regulator [Nitratireductor mangrovi]QDZ03104.1 TetR/AcrR family transcriptional regulator [Nitratireductor mangrovi]
MSLGVREQVADSSRADILRAAAKCFMERGYAGTSIDDVARSLGATKGRIYHHFPSKADLFAEVFRAGMDMNYQAVEPLADVPGPALPRWRKMAMTHVLQMMVTKPFQRVVWIGVEMHLRGATTPEQRDALRELIDYRSNYGNLFRATLLQGREEGVFEFGDMSITNQLMFMTLNSPIFWYTPRVGETRADIENIASQVVDYALGGLCGKREKSR